MTDEWLSIFRTCWEAERPAFEGKHYRFDPLVFHPRPPHRIPIWIGGSSPPSLRRAGRVGDGWKAAGQSTAEIAEAIPTLRRYAGAAGHDPLRFAIATIRDLTVLPPEQADAARLEQHLVGTEEQLAEAVMQLEAIGVTHVALRVQALSHVDETPSVERGLEVLDRFFGDVLPRCVRA